MRLALGTCGKEPRTARTAATTAPHRVGRLPDEQLLRLGIFLPVCCGLRCFVTPACLPVVVHISEIRTWVP